MINDFKLFCFVVLCSKPLIDDRVDRLIMKLIESMGDLDLNGFSWNGFILSFESKYKYLPTIHSYPKIDGTERRDLVSYLIRCKRFNIVETLNVNFNRELELFHFFFVL